MPLLANGMSLYHGLLFSQCRLKVASPNDNFTLFRANCKEDHKVVHIFTKQLLSYIVRIESKTYSCLTIGKLPFTLSLYHLI